MRKMEGKGARLLRVARGRVKVGVRMGMWGLAIVAVRTKYGADKEAGK